MNPYIIIISLLVFGGCYIQPRPLPNWKADRLSRRGQLPCSSWHKGQRLGDGKRVVRVGNGYITIRLRSGETINMGCAP